MAFHWSIVHTGKGQETSFQKCKALGPQIIWEFVWHFCLLGWWLGFADVLVAQGRFARKSQSWSDPSRIFSILLSLTLVSIPSALYFILPFLSRWCCRKKHQWSSYGGSVKYPHTKQEMQLLPNADNLNSRLDIKILPMGRLCRGSLLSSCI